MQEATAQRLRPIRSPALIRPASAGLSSGRPPASANWQVRSSWPANTGLVFYRFRHRRALKHVLGTERALELELGTGSHELGARDDELGPHLPRLVGGHLRVELCAARGAARGGALGAAWCAARVAARNAVRGAVRNAARNAARGAARGPQWGHCAFEARLEAGRRRRGGRAGGAVGLARLSGLGTAWRGPRCAPA